MKRLTAGGTGGWGRKIFIIAEKYVHFLNFALVSELIPCSGQSCKSKSGRSLINRSNARYSLSKSISIDSLQTAFVLYDLIEQAEAKGEKVNNYALAKQVGIKVEQRNTEEGWVIAYKRRVVYVAVSRKKRVALDAIAQVIFGQFP